MIKKADEYADYGFELKAVLKDRQKAKGRRQKAKGYEQGCKGLYLILKIVVVLIILLPR